jgi:ABC-type uncharacterized transport system substrate-binding protein
VGVARGIFERRGIQLQEIAITGTSEILQAAQVLTRRGVQALWVTGDNTAFQGFDAIVKAARDAKLPLIINDPELVQRGALIAVGTGWYETGKAASKVLALEKTLRALIRRQERLHFLAQRVVARAGREDVGLTVGGGQCARAREHLFQALPITGRECHVG